MKWNVLKDMHKLYENGRIKWKSSFVKDSEVSHLVHSTKELCVTRKEVVVPENSTFPNTYKKLYQADFNRYSTFLNDNELEKPQTRFENTDIEILINIKEQMDSGSLKPLREQILKANETVRGISFMFFKHEKYLDEKKSLIEAIEKILDVSELPSGKDKQYLYVVPCKSAKAILLCENLYFLRVPERVSKYNIEIWFAGGYNVKMLENVNTRNLPIFYSGDWDYDGLKIFDLVQAKIPQIELLFPNAQPVNIVTTEHKSRWKEPQTPESLSGLNCALFGHKEKELIQSLITENNWIVEESNDIAEMIKNKLEGI